MPEQRAQQSEATAMQQAPDLETLKSDADSGIPGAQYNLGVWHLQQPDGERDVDAAREAFESAVTQGFAPAMSALGYLYLRSQGVDFDAQKAAELFDQSANAGFSEAIYRRGELRAAGCGTEQDIAGARRDYEAAAEKGHAGAMTQLAYCLTRGIAGEVDPLLATGWYSRAAVAGDPRAQCCIAWRYETGHTLPKNDALSFDWYVRAATVGYKAAVLAADRLAPTRSPQDVEEARSRAARTPPPIDSPEQAGSVSTKPSGPQPISWSPRVFTFPEFLSQDECFHLISLARPFLRRAMVLDRKTGEQVVGEARSSRNTRMLNPLRDIVVEEVEQRLARYAMLPAANAEPITIIYYGVGDQYEPHSDYYPPDDPGSQVGLAKGGQRLATFLTYLNAVEEGGDTVFPEADISVSPTPGMGLLWFNTLHDRTPDRKTLHAGLPVRKGEKWLLSRWIREKEYPMTNG
jgi:prolyl 4-hydroxylase